MLLLEKFPANLLLILVLCILVLYDYLNVLGLNNLPCCKTNRCQCNANLQEGKAPVTHSNQVRKQADLLPFHEVTWTTEHAQIWQ